MKIQSTHSEPSSTFQRSYVLRIVLNILVVFSSHATEENDVSVKLKNADLYTAAAAATAKSLQSCPTLCDTRDGSPPGSPIPGVLQARTLEWVAISFCNAWKWKAKGKSLSCVRLLATLWTAAYQALPSMGFSRQEYWSGVPLPSPDVETTMFKKISYRIYI